MSQQNLKWECDLHEVMMRYAPQAADPLFHILDAKSGMFGLQFEFDDEAAKFHMALMDRLKRRRNFPEQMRHHKLSSTLETRPVTILKPVPVSALLNGKSTAPIMEELSSKKQ